MSAASAPEVPGGSFTPAQWRMLLLIVLGALLLRVAALDRLPPGLFRDEAEKLATGWSLATTGRDLAGRPMPLFVQVFGVTTSAIYQYAAVPFVWLLGPGTWSARLPAAFAGTLTVLLAALATRRLFGPGAALIAAVLLAVSPWHLPLSRWALQGIFMPLFVAAGLHQWLRFRDGRRGALPLAALFLGLAAYAYEIGRLYVPLLLLLLTACSWRLMLTRWKETLGAALVMIVTAAPVLVLLATETAAAQARFRAISIFQPGVTPLGAAGAFAGNYVAHFSPGFLLLHGDAELRHSAGTGMVTLLEVLLVLASLAFAVRGRLAGAWLLGAMLLLAPLPASLTREGIPHALRSILMLPALQMLAAGGAAALLAWVSSRPPSWAWLRAALVPAGAALFFVTTALTGLTYFVRYPAMSAPHWQHGVREGIAYFRETAPPGASLVFYNLLGAEYFALIEWPVAPSEFQLNGLRDYPFVQPPFHFPVPQLYAAHADEAAAFLMMPQDEPPPGGAIVPIRGPGGLVARVLYLNARYAEGLTTGTAAAGALSD